MDQEIHIKDHVLAFESDAGVFRPTGWGFTGLPCAKAIVAEIATKFLSSIGAKDVLDGGGAADTAPLIARGVPGMNIRIENQKYFWYHHSHSDMMTHLSSEDMDLCSASVSVMMFVIADIDERLPRQ